MTSTSQIIIATLEKTYPQTGQLIVRHFGDASFGITQKVLNQFILGVCPLDRFSNGIEPYEHRIKEVLQGITQHVTCLAWPFNGYERAEMKAVLDELAVYLSIEIDSDRMINALKIPRDEEGIYYVVVTVVQYPIAYIDER